MKFKKQLYTYLLAIFLIGFFIMVYWILESYHSTPTTSSSTEVNSYRSFAEVFNTANTFIKNKQYTMAINTLESLKTNELKPSQKQAVKYLLAYVNRCLGLYHSAEDALLSALQMKEDLVGLLLLADMRRRMNRILEATAIYQKIIKQYPNETQAYEQLGNLYFQQGDMVNALEAFEAKGNLKKLPAKMVLKQAICLFFLGEHERSMSLLERKVVSQRLSPHKDIAHLMVAVNFKKMERFNDAHDAYSKAIGFMRMPEKRLALYLKVMNFIDMKRYDDAIQLLQDMRLLDETGSTFNETYLLGMLHFFKKDYRESYAFFRTLMNRDRRSRYYHAVCVYYMQDYKRAINLFKIFLHESQEKDDYRYSAYVLSALAYANLGYETVWRSLLKEALDIWGERERTIVVLGYLCLKYLPDELDTLMKPYLKQYTSVQLLVAEYFKKNKEWDKAIEHYLQIHERHQASVTLYKQMGDIYLYMKHYQEAISYYRWILEQEITPRMRLRVVNNMAYCLSKKNLLKEAYTQLQQALDAHDSDRQYRVGVPFNLSLIAKAADDLVHYGSHLHQSLQYIHELDDPSLKANVYYEAALYALSNTQDKTAINYLQRALEANPNHMKSAYLLKQRYERSP